jgi:hypothetical protein
MNWRLGGGGQSQLDVLEKRRGFKPGIVKPIAYSLHRLSLPTTARGKHGAAVLWR